VADITVNGLPEFPNGTSVKAYPLSNWNGASYTGAAPVGSEDATATVTAGVAAFTGLDADTRYVAYAQVSSEHRYKRFSTLSEYARNTGGSGGILSDGSVTAAKLASTLAAIEAWTDLGSLGATETINGAANKVIRRKGTLDQACAITLSMSADQQIDLVLVQDGTGGRAATFTGVNVWLTNAGTAPSLTGRSALAVDRFFFDNVGGVVYGSWLTETISGGGSLTVQDENGNVATGVTQIDVQGPGAVAVAGSGEAIIRVGRGRSGTAPTAALAETVPRSSTLSNQAVLLSGRRTLFGIELIEGLVINGISFFSSSTALSGGSNQWFELLDVNRNRLAVTTDDGATAWASSSKKALNFASAYTVPSSGFYYLGIMVNATTVPTLLCLNVGASSVMGEVPILGGNADTGLTTPASAPSPATALGTIGNVAYAFVH
jgi:hypothetical protein